jgi:trimethylamine--corrinoid protein Co-methyltransferase
MSDERPVRSLPLSRRLDVLSQGDVEKLHEQTLILLERVGIGVGSEKIRQALAESGASVDEDAKRVRFSPTMVEEAVGRAPRSYVLASRTPGADLDVSGERGYLTVDGCAAEIIDIETGERRPSTKEDLAMATRLADAIPEVSFLWQPVAVREVPEKVESLHEIHVQFANTGKHIQMMTAVTESAAKGVIEISKVVAGGADELRKRPIISAFECSLSPMSYDEGSLEAAVVYAKAGVPCGFVVMPISCASAPATVGGTLAQSNAEVLAGIVVLETLVPGALTFYGSCATVMDLHSGTAACGGPEDLFYQMASAQMARFYNIPASIGTFATGAKTPDWQAGVENGLSGLASALAGADLICGAGLLYSASVYSFEQLLLDTEIFRLLCHLFGAPSAAVDESFMPVMESVGPGGQFLAERHTVDHMRRLWMPRFFDRKSWEEWEAAGKPGPRQAAREKVRQLLSAHEPPLLEEGMEKEIHGIIGAYERD